MGASNPPIASSEIRFWATRGESPRIVAFSSSGSSGPPAVAVEVFDAEGLRLHRHAPAGDVRMRVWGLIGDTLVIEEFGALHGMDERSERLERRWTAEPLLAQIERVMGPGVTVEPRLVAESAETPAAALFLVTVPEEGSRLARLDAFTGALSFSSPSEHVLRGLLGDDGRGLYATVEGGVVRLDEAGQLEWFVPCAVAWVEAALDGSVYLSDGAVLDAQTGSVRYEFPDGLRAAWITRERLYFPKPARRPVHGARVARCGCTRPGAAPTWARGPSRTTRSPIRWWVVTARCTCSRRRSGTLRSSRKGRACSASRWSRSTATAHP